MIMVRGISVRRAVAAGAALAWVAGSGCGSSSTPSGPDASAPDASDATALDGSAEAGGDEAGSGADAGSTDGGAPDAAGCRPGNISGYQPVRPVGPTPLSTACRAFDGDGGLVQAFGDACLGHAATYDSCAALGAPDAAGAAACFGCLLTPDDPDAASWGAAIAAPVPTVNYIGCIEALDPSAAGASCAAAVAAAEGCAAYACTASCPVTDDPSRSAYLGCVDAALSGACVAYALRAQACLAAEEGDGGTPIATICLAGTTAEDHYLAVARHFCAGQ